MAIATQTTENAKDTSEIQRVLDSLYKAHFEKNAAAIAAPYATDASLFTLSPPLEHRGISVQEQQAWLDTWEGPIDLQSSNMEIIVSGDSAFTHGFVQMSGTPKSAGRHMSFWMRSTVCLRRDEDAWQIVHDHVSVPFYMDGSERPAFDLKP
jgi:ketosteroid isomerase-like protein